MDKAVNIAGFYLPSKIAKTESKEEQEETNNDNDASIEESVQKLSINDTEKSLPCDDQKTDELDENNNEENNDEDYNDAVDDNDNDDGWINPSNIKQINKNNQIDSEEQDIRDIKLKVACMTADFAMQVYFFIIF